MEDTKVQQNLEKNIEKVFEKIQEEGLKGVYLDNNCYPIEEKLTVEKLYILGSKIKIAETEIVIKNYNSYMKLIQTLDTLISMYGRLNVKDSDQFNKIKNAIESQIEIIQNTGLQSLDKNYISQYSCLIKCYDSLLRMSRIFERNVFNVSLPQHKNNVILTNDIDKEKVEKYFKQSLNIFKDKNTY